MSARTEAVDIDTDTDSADGYWASAAALSQRQERESYELTLHHISEQLRLARRFQDHTAVADAQRALHHLTQQFQRGTRA